ncbi:hypothetical protein D9V86_10320 [Bacteroidetes/Chlorobi group bacterium ChocPot_Mid]|jgi:hypothetical protein|nr:MAG: hypothetical protein D9V86_10320 [Bacteroidetes/Chlorobi group bacterium ChocPot_Mid]
MENTETTPNQVYPPNVQVLDFSSILTRMSKDMTFLAIFLIVYGALSCLTIIGALIGVPYIFAGLRMKESAEHFRNYAFGNNVAELHYAIERQQRMFFIFKVLAIIAIVLLVFVIIFYSWLISVILSGNLPMFQHFNDAV